MEGDEIELIDIEAMGVCLDGLSISQIRQIVNFYKSRTGDVDLERVDYFTKGLK